MTLCLSFRCLDVSRFNDLVLRECCVEQLSSFHHGILLAITPKNKQRIVRGTLVHSF